MEAADGGRNMIRNDRNTEDRKEKGTEEGAPISHVLASPGMQSESARMMEYENENDYVKELAVQAEPDFPHEKRAVSDVAPKPVVLRSFTDVRTQSDFLHMFRDRYERLSGILRHRARGAVQIRALMNKTSNGRGGRRIRTDSRDVGEEVSVIGMVSSMRKTAKGNTIVEIEDMTGYLPVILRQNLAENIIEDEVICVSGHILESGYLLANSVIRPDVPIIRHDRPHTASDHKVERGNYENKEQAENEISGSPAVAVFISDIHAGSRTFMEDAWCSFIDWIRENAAAMNIAYLCVAGDIVDGIGVYPEQERDLELRDVEEQYALVASYLKRLPSSIHIVLSPGNHDAVRNAEPQPPLPQHIQKMFPQNTIFVSNPAYIIMGGRTVLIYHGQSYDDFISAIPRLKYDKPEAVMIEMLKRRHVAPIYGRSVSVFPSMHDYGVIEPIPDIMHCGHTHTVGITSYRHVLLINSGTWQSQTSYQKKRGISPVTCRATLVNLAEMRVKMQIFTDAPVS